MRILWMEYNKRDINRMCSLWGTSQMVRTIKLIWTCPHCSEAIALEVTRRQAKAILKAFNLPETEANKLMEKALLGEC
jgi:hypothetical protein